MGNPKVTRTSLEVSENIASVLERIDPGAYPDTEHVGTVDYVNRALHGRTFMTPESFLASIRRQAHQSGLSQEMNPLVKEARNLLGIPSRRTQRKVRQTRLGR